MGRDSVHAGTTRKYKKNYEIYATEGKWGATQDLAEDAAVNLQSTFRGFYTIYGRHLSIGNLVKIF